MAANMVICQIFMGTIFLLLIYFRKSNQDNFLLLFQLKRFARSNLSINSIFNGIVKKNSSFWI